MTERGSLPADTMALLQQRVFEQLSRNKQNPVLAEMAREILAGRLTLREAASLGAYAEALFSAGHAGVSKIIAMPEEERETLVRQGVAALDQPDDPGDDVPADTHQAEPVDTDELSGSIMVGVAMQRGHGGTSAAPPQRSRWTRRWQ